MISVMNYQNPSAHGNADIVSRKLLAGATFYDYNSDLYGVVSDINMSQNQFMGQIEIIIQVMK